MEKKVYNAELHITEKNFDEINKLFKVDFNEVDKNENLTAEMQQLIDDTDARPYTNPYSFLMNFENGKSLTLTVCSGQNNFWDEWNLYGNNKEHLMTFDCGFQLDETMEFIYQDTIYMVNIVFLVEKERLRIEDFTEEEHELYYKIKQAHTIEDVMSRTNCTAEEADAIAERAEEILDKCDRYYEAYWDCIDEAYWDCIDMAIEEVENV